MTKAERTRQLIISKSAPIFNTKGVAGTSMSDILDVTKLAKGSLYVHFESKKELSYAVVDYQLAKLSDVVETGLNKHQTAKAKLFAYIDTFIDPLDPPLEGGCPMLNFGMEADDTDEVIRKKVNAVIEGAQQTIERIIQEGIALGEFKSDWEPGEFATKLFALVEGGIMMSRIAGNNKSMKVIARSLKKEIEEKEV
ncbi:TetR/AcrR family transcriptional regulator [Spirosoma endbachense]|uniref:TetR family transcriptional regulator n=1 Tax=Spirosoma endbachense TaxID=2666025 RepID=A0A6P1W9J0_9BACT|nr:TetR/AcrR family transcriptional regulator [Spirosoma endbachense]QHW00581.1 TetR family transcriptional regulator [Spirosoma endbachense]